MAAEMARSGFVAGQNLYERDKGLLPSFLKGAEYVVPELDFDKQWYVLRNGYKRFASCRATHAAAEAAQSVKDQIGNRTVTKIKAFVNPIALVAAGNPAPKTGLEARFSTYCCIAMGLAGYRLSAFDFTDEMVADPAIAEMLPKIECIPVKGQSEVAAKLQIDLSDGQRMEASVDIVLGHPDRPLSWAQIQDKFEGLVVPVLGDAKASDLFTAVTGFATGKGQSIPQISALLAPRLY